MVEEGRWWREGGIREFLRKNKGRIFLRKNGSEEILWKNREERKKKFGIYSREICILSEGGCYPFSWYVGSGARKPVGFLGPANLLVGRVENQSWQ